MDKTINFNIDNIFFIIIILNIFFYLFYKLKHKLCVLLSAIYLTHYKKNNEFMENKTRYFNILNCNAFCILS